MAVSPLLDSDGVLRINVRCNGAPQPGLALLSVHTRHALNEVPWAKLVLQDGDMAQGTVPLSDGELFEPGAAIEVFAGYGEEESLIFTGIVLRHGFSFGDGNAGRLSLECRASAFKMGLARQTAHYANQTDADILSSLIGQHGLTANVASTSIQHETLVQYGCSDWDFLLARADALGLLVNVDGTRVTVQAPDGSAQPVLSVSWGESLMDFNADLDASTQWAEVQASNWSPAQQAMLQGHAARPAATSGQGNLSGAKLAEATAPARPALQTCALQPNGVLHAWAKAVQEKAALARIRGSCRFQGSALAKPGAMIELKGVGDRFSGNAFMSAVEHELVDGQWFSRVNFGLDPTWHVHQKGLEAAPNGGLVPGVAGLQIGVVVKLEGDPAGEHRIQVRLPQATAGTDLLWARLLQPQASAAFGSFFVPDIGDEVLLGHLNQDPAHPVVLGSLYSSKHQPPEALNDENAIRAIVTRGKHRLAFNDATGEITLTTAQQNQLVLSDQDKGLLIKDQNGNSIRLCAAGIALESPKDIVLKANGSIRLDALNALQVQSKADVSVQGLNVLCQAQISLQAKGAASAELSSAGQTQVQGGMVLIN